MLQTGAKHFSVKLVFAERTPFRSHDAAGLIVSDVMSHRRDAEVTA